MYPVWHTGSLFGISDLSLLKLITGTYWTLSNGFKIDFAPVNMILLLVIWIFMYLACVLLLVIVRHYQ